VLQHDGHKSTYESSEFLCKDIDKEKITSLKMVARAVYESATQPSMFHRLAAASGSVKVPRSVAQPLVQQVDSVTPPPAVSTQEQNDSGIPAEDQSESMEGTVYNFEDVSLQHDHPGHADLLVHIDISSQRRAVEMVIAKKIFGRWRGGLREPWKVSLSSIVV
jgi:hypothetical protein